MGNLQFSNYEEVEKLFNNNDLINAYIQAENLDICELLQKINKTTNQRFKQFINYVLNN